MSKASYQTIAWIDAKDRIPDWSIHEKIYVLLEDDEIYTCLPNECLDNRWDTIGWQMCHYCGGTNTVVFEEEKDMYHKKLATKWAYVNES